MNPAAVPFVELCGQARCSRHATHSYTWPGTRGRLLLCYRCLPLLRLASEGLGLCIEPEPLPDPLCDGCDSRRSACAALTLPAIKCCPDCSHQ